MSISLALLSLCPVLPQEESGPFVHELFSGLPERWEAALETMRVPGAAVSVVLDDTTLVLHAMGQRDVVRQKPVTPDTAFYIASATKPFVALAVLGLVDDGLLQLDDPVRKHLPRFTLADPEASATVTVRDLLCHAQGLNDYRIVLLDAYTGEITDDRYYRFLADVEPAGPRYTNVNLTLAGKVLEARRGQGWRDVLRERVFEPLGMNATTGYADEMYAREDVAFPTEWDGERFVLAGVRKTNATMHAAGGLGTSARDAAQWLRANLNGGLVDGTRIVSAGGMEEMLTLQCELPESRGDYGGSRGFGLGWMRAEIDGLAMWKHGGGYVGSAALLSFLPEVGLGITVLANTGGAGHALCEMITRDVIGRVLALDEPDYLQGYLSAGDRGPAPTPEPMLASALDFRLPLDAYLGSYLSEDFGTLRFTESDGELSLHLGGLRLHPSLPDEGEGGDRLRFGGSFDGTLSFVIEGERVTAIEATIEIASTRFERLP